MDFNLFFTNLLAKLTANIVSAGGRAAKKKFATSEHQQALQRCVEAGLLPLRERLIQLPAERHERARVVLEGFFAADDVHTELAQVLRQQDPDADTLRDVLLDQGYDPDNIGADWPGALEQFHFAFQLNARKEPSLQDFLQTAALEDIRELSQEQLATLEMISHQLQQTAPQGGITADTITATNVVSGIQVVLQQQPSEKPGLEAAYLRAVYADAARLPLATIIQNEAEGADAALTLDGVFTGLLTKRSVILNEEPLIAKTRSTPGSPSHLLAKNRRMVLLGDPGSGKSTFVNFLALCLAGEHLGYPANLTTLKQPIPREEEEEEFPNDWNLGALFPVRVILRDFAAEILEGSETEASASVLSSYIQKQTDDLVDGSYGETLLDKLRTGDALLLLDGLDEVANSAQVRGKLLQIVEAFATVYECPILVTCRIYAWEKQNWRLDSEEFEVEVLDDFRPAQIRAFVEGWYRHAAAKRQIVDNSAALNQAIRDRPEISELARRPLLLTLMTALHASGRVGLPRKRQQLYAETVELLMHRWLKPVDLPGVEGRQSILERHGIAKEGLHRGLAKVAYEAHARQAPGEDRAADIEQSALEAMLGTLCPDNLNARVLLEEHLADKTGILIARGEAMYSFPHRTFQEYFAAFHLADNQPERLHDMLPADPDRWREVCLLTAACSHGDVTAPFWQFLRELCPEAEDDPLDRDAALRTLIAGQALVENVENVGGDSVSAGNRDVVEKLRQRLVLVLPSELPPVERAAAGRALGVLGDPRFDPDRWFLPKDQANAADGFVAITGNSEIDDFAIGIFPVTNAQFQCFVKDGGYNEPRYWILAAEHGQWRDGRIKHWSGDWDAGPHEFNADFSLPNHPVVGVGWYEAHAYAQWLGERLDRPVRLPTAEEWQHAASSGDGRKYPWGEAEDSHRANTEESGIGRTCTPGCFAAPDLANGLQDMAGNVWEWTQSRERGIFPTSDRDPMTIKGGEFSGELYSCADRLRSLSAWWRPRPLDSDFSGLWVFSDPALAGSFFLSSGLIWLLVHLLHHPDAQAIGGTMLGVGDPAANRTQQGVPFFRMLLGTQVQGAKPARGGNRVAALEPPLMGAQDKAEKRRSLRREPYGGRRGNFRPLAATTPENQTCG